jgi:hypothetical protein
MCFWIHLDRHDRRPRIATERSHPLDSCTPEHASSEAGLENPVSRRTSGPADEEGGDNGIGVVGPARLLNLRQ